MLTKFHLRSHILDNTFCSVISPHTYCFSIKPTFIDINHLCLFSVTKQFCNFASNFYIILYVSEEAHALHILKICKL